MKKEIFGSRILHDGTQHNIKLVNLERINILFGKNGCGKSSFLRRLYQSDPNTFHLVVPERGGNTSHNSSLVDLEFNESRKKEARNKNSDEQYRSRAISRASQIMNMAGSQAMDGKTENIISRSEITRLFGTFLPEFEVSFSKIEPFRLEIYRVIDETKKLVNGSDELSSGQAEALSLAADIITQAVLWSNQEKTLLIDEPDTHLHLDLQNRFAIFIAEVAEKFNIQIIIATHSPALIASLLSLSDDIGVFCLDPQLETIAAVKKDNNSIFSNLLNIDLGLAVVLGRKIYIVEGNDDYLVWNQACRSRQFNDASIVQSNGQDIYLYKKNAEKIIKSVLDAQGQIGITILDGDNKDDPAKSEGEVLPFARLQCYSLENLFLTNQVLDYVKTEVNLVAELEELKLLVTKEEQTVLDSLIKDKKNTKIPKELIKKIQNKIDDHRSSRDWRIILGKVLGIRRPEGELAEFIGKEIVEYIWGNLLQRNMNKH